MPILRASEEDLKSFIGDIMRIYGVSKSFCFVFDREAHKNMLYRSFDNLFNIG